MNRFALLLDFVGPGPAVAAPGGRAAALSSAERLALATLGFLSALVASAVWGVAAGMRGGHPAYSNAIVVPTLFAASALVALPVSLLAYKLFVRDARASVLVVAHAAGAFAGTAVLALLAPAVALYQSSSGWGTAVGIATVLAAAGVGVVIVVRTAVKLLPSDAARRGIAIPIALLVVVQSAAISQLASTAAPVFPERTRFGRGIDAIGAAPSSEVAP